MLTDRRNAERYAINGIARIDWGPGATCECLLVNFSDEGVRIHVERDDVPNQFWLQISGQSALRLSCQVAWRLGYEIGAKFAEAQAGAARQLADVLLERKPFGRRFRDDARTAV
jgi:hypothetical protein